MSPRRTLPSLVAALALAVPAAAADSPVSVAPLVGTPDTAFRVVVPASFPVRQIRDRYWFILSGPAGGGRPARSAGREPQGDRPRAVVRGRVPGARGVLGLASADTPIRPSPARNVLCRGTSGE